jgi:polysaccharide export outer membrane protein
MFMRAASRLLAVLMLVACASCATGAPAASGSSSHPVAPEAYVLGPGDKLHIAVFGREELTGDYSIGTQGRISYPLLGEIEASGKTVPEFGDFLGQQLSNGYVQNPIVSVEVATYRPFFILGEVQRPGAYPYAPGMTVMSAVATAGGFSYRANSRRVFIQHPGETGERGYTLTSSTEVQAGDTVRIPERLF